jgi:hypothetical protein
MAQVAATSKLPHFWLITANIIGVPLIGYLIFTDTSSDPLAAVFVPALFLLAILDFGYILRMVTKSLPRRVHMALVLGGIIAFILFIVRSTS